MKTIDSKELFGAGKRGEIDISQMRKMLLGKNTAKQKIDDREPEERMADEFEGLAESIRLMNKAQSEQFNRLLQSLLSSVEKLKDGKSNSGKWEIEVDAKRDHRGLLEYPYKIKITRA